ncbi:MAG: hypothetical protein ACI9VN_002297 [Patescibacteria group bacterium]|jgi:hypothetical protein
MKKYLILILLTLYLSGCTRKYQFGFLKTDFKIEKKDLIKDKVLSIEIFEDVRINEEENNVHLNKRKIYKGEDGKVCINSEKGYRQPLNYNLTKVTATYMKRSQLFKNVVYGKKRISDYYVTAKLKNYRTTQEFSKEAHRDAIKRAAVSASFGVVGGLIIGRPDEFESYGQIVIELDEVTLYNKEDELIKKIGLIENKVNGLFPADSDCWCAYWAAEDNYPKVVEELLKSIILAIEKSGPN